MSGLAETDALRAENQALKRAVRLEIYGNLERGISPHMLSVLAIALPTEGERYWSPATENLRASLQAGVLPLIDLEQMVSRLGFTFGVNGA